MCARLASVDFLGDATVVALGAGNDLTGVPAAHDDAVTDGRDGPARWRCPRTWRIGGGTPQRVGREDEDGRQCKAQKRDREDQGRRCPTADIAERLVDRTVGRLISLSGSGR